MHCLEFETLAAVDRHQTDRVHVQGACGNLTKVAFLGEKHQLAHAIERTLDRRLDAINRGTPVSDTAATIAEQFNRLGGRVRP